FNQEQDFSLVLENLILSQKNPFQTVFECSIDRLINWDFYTWYQKAQLYLIVQVLLQNVNKHAHASKCLVIILLSEQHIVVKIHDNGIGIDTKKINKGLGFKNIRHRLQSLQGKMTISTLNQMTTISLEIPYSEKEV
ncbi:two-component sensor histidine kinase, partial [Myroides marinus]